MTIENPTDMNRPGERGLHLRRRIAKLRWMRLDGEADRAAAEIARIGCDQPPVVPRVPVATD